MRLLGEYTICFKTITRILPLAIVVPYCAGCQQVGEPAAIALAAFGAFGLGSQVLTHSEVKVDVEVFQDTKFEQAKSPPGSDTGWLLRGGPGLPEVEGQSAETVRVIDPVKAPSQAAFVQVRDQVAPDMNALRQSIGSVRELAMKLEPATDSTWRKLHEALSSRIRQFEFAENVWNEFCSRVAEGAPPTESSLQETANTLQRFRDAIEPLKSEAPERIYSEYIAAELQLAVYGVDSEQAEKLEMEFRSLLVSPDLPEDGRVPLLLDETRKAVASIPNSERKQEAKDAVEEVISRAGVQGMSPSEFLMAMAEPNKIAKTIQIKTFPNVTVNYNRGPLVNEVMQQILAKNGYIDVLADEANEPYWRKMNCAHSKSGLGNHDAVIYLENWATPFLKSSKFDPTKFLVAHGALYRRAFTTVGQVLGVPVAGATPPAHLTGLNIYDIQAREALAQASYRATRQTTLGSMKAMIEIQEAVKLAETRTDAPKPGAWTDDAKKAAALESAKARIAATITALETLK